MGNALEPAARIESEENAEGTGTRPPKLESRTSSDVEDAHVAGMQEVAG